MCKAYKLYFYNSCVATAVVFLEPAKVGDLCYRTVFNIAVEYSEAN